MMVRAFVFLFVSIIFFSAHARITEPLRRACTSGVTDGRAWDLCVHEYANSGRDVLYYFHGMGAGTRAGFDEERFERNMMQEWIKSGKPLPVVVTVSFGNLWLMVEKNSSSASGLYDIFQNEIKPLVQKTMLPFVPEKTYLVGLSMGAFNAMQLYFKDLALNITRAALICPPVTVISPFDGAHAVQRYIMRTGAVPWMAKLALNTSLNHMPTPADWLANSPLDLAIQNFSPQSIPLYVANGLADQFGFHEGDQVFVRLALARGAPVESDWYSGKGHCLIDSSKIVEFLTR